MLIRIEPEAGPIFRQIHGQIRNAIGDGRLPAGARLPATRTLARDLGVSRTVVTQAYDWLRAEGFLSATVGSGTYVQARFATGSGDASSVRPTRAPALSRWGRAALDAPWDAGADARYDLRSGRIDPEALPGTAWRRAVSRATRRGGSGDASPAGIGRLRVALASYLARSRGVRCDADRIFVVNGSQQGLDLVARVLLDPGDRVVLEDPSYHGIRHALRAAGAVLDHVAVDDQGLDPDALRDREPARLVCITPSHQFPSGAVLPIHRRLALLEWARRHEALLVEDDYDSELRFDHPPVEAVQGLDPGLVLYLGTVTKLLSPGLRIGYLVVPDGLADAFAAAKWLTDRQSPTLEQEALADFIEDGMLDRHVRRARGVLRRKRDVLVDALKRRFPEGAVALSGEQAGAHLVAWLADVPAARADDVVAAARARGVAVSSVAPYYRDPPARCGLLLGYAAPVQVLREGVRRLAEAVDDLVRGTGTGGGEREGRGR